MKIILETPEKIVLRMDGNVSLANALRRSIEEVPTLAIDEVEFFKNDSALYDEFVAHRLGLLPLKMDSKMNSKTEVSLTLKKSGPGMVYSGDLKGSGKVVFDKVPITLLEKGQEFEVIATARLGNGLEHAKYLPGLIWYRKLLKVSSKNSRINEIINNSEGIVKEKQGNSWIIDLAESEEEEISGIDKDAIKDHDELLFFVESFGQRNAKDIVIGCVKALEGNLNEVEKFIK